MGVGPGRGGRVCERYFALACFAACCVYSSKFWISTHTHTSSCPALKPCTGPCSSPIRSANTRSSSSPCEGFNVNCVLCLVFHSINLMAPRVATAMACGSCPWAKMKSQSAPESTVRACTLLHTRRSVSKAYCTCSQVFLKQYTPRYWQKFSLHK